MKIISQIFEYIRLGSTPNRISNIRYFILLNVYWFLRTIVPFAVIYFLAFGLGGRENGGEIVFGLMILGTPIYLLFVLYSIWRIDIPLTKKRLNDMSNLSIQARRVYLFSLFVPAAIITAKVFFTSCSVCDSLLMYSFALSAGLLFWLLVGRSVPGKNKLGKQPKKATMKEKLFAIGFLMGDVLVILFFLR